MFLERRLTSQQTVWLTQQHETALTELLAGVPEDGLRYEARLAALLRAGWVCSVDGAHLIHPVTKRLTSKREAIDVTLRLRPQTRSSDCAYKLGATWRNYCTLVDNAKTIDLRVEGNKQLPIEIAR